MPTYEQLMEGARKADAAGDAAGAKRFLELAKASRTQPNANWRDAQPPEGMTLDPISGQMRDPEMRARANPQNMAQGMARAAQQGVGLGLGDEFNAGVAATEDALMGRAGWKDAYDSRLADERAMLDQFRGDHPVAAYGSEIGGAMLLPAAGMKAGASLGQNALRMGASGAATGAAYGFGAGEGDFGSRARSAAVGGAVGGAVGAAMPYALNGAQRLAQGRATGKALDDAAAAAPSIDDLRAQASALYDAAAQRGVRIKEGAFTPLVDDVTTMAGQMGADPDLTPKAWAALRRLGDAKGKGDVSWQDMETLRRITSIASTAKDPADRRVAGAIVQRVDDFVLNLVDGDLSAGSAQGLSKELTEARGLWKQMRTSERLAGAMEAAKDAASGYENGLRIEFRKLLKDQKFFRSLSKGEQEAVRAVVRGSPTGNLLKRVGRLSFGHGAQTNVLGASVGAGLGATAGGMAGGPVGAVIGGAATAGAGSLAARGSERATERLAQRATGIAAAGGLPTLPVASEPFLIGNALAGVQRGAAPAAVNLWNR